MKKLILVLCLFLCGCATIPQPCYKPACYSNVIFKKDVHVTADYAVISGSRIEGRLYVYGDNNTLLCND